MFFIDFDPLRPIFDPQNRVFGGQNRAWGGVEIVDFDPLGAILTPQIDFGVKNRYMVSKSMKIDVFVSDSAFLRQKSVLRPVSKGVWAKKRPQTAKRPNFFEKTCFLKNEKKIFEKIFEKKIFEKFFRKNFCKFFIIFFFAKSFHTIFLYNS